GLVLSRVSLRRSAPQAATASWSGGKQATAITRDPMRIFLGGGGNRAKRTFDYAFFLVLARSAAQRLRCASAMRLRPSALILRRFAGFDALTAFAALCPAGVEMTPMVANSLRACCSRAISESI